METALRIISDVWSTLSQMSPFMLLGLLVAGLLSALVSPEAVERHLGGTGPWPVIKASLFGVPLPLCSCGVIPVAASLRKHGASKGATTAFLLSTPQTGVDSILVTYSLLGPVFAIFRPVAAFVTGLVGGWIVDVVEKRDVATQDSESCQDECCVPTRREIWPVRALRYGFVTLPRDIGRALLAGLVIAGVITALVPDGLLSNSIGTGIGAMLVMMAVGIPIYVCATASVPIAAAMIAKGISPGAALVFLMTGPATNVASLAVIWRVMGRRVALVYLGVVAGTALTCGLLLDWIIVKNFVPAIHHAHTMLPQWFYSGSAFVLLGVLGINLLRPGHHAKGHKHHEKADHDDVTTELKIKGMTCSHCVEAVRKGLLEQRGVHAVDVSLQTGMAIVSGSGYDTAVLKDVVASLGYKTEMMETGRNQQV